MERHQFRTMRDKPLPHIIICDPDSFTAGKFAITVKFENDSDLSVSRVFANHQAGKQFAECIMQTKTDPISWALFELWERGVSSLHLSLVMPLSVAPNKPCLCQNQRFLFCWMKVTSFSLDSLIDLPDMLSRAIFRQSLTTNLVMTTSSWVRGVALWWASNGAAGVLSTNGLPLGWIISPRK